MKKIGYIFFGIMLGLMIHNFFKSPDKNFRLKNDINNELTSSPEDIEIKQAAANVKIKTEKIKSLPAHVINNMENENHLLNENSPVDNQIEAKHGVKPRILELIISEEIVTELEKNWQDLPYQIRLSAEDRGLRVSYLSENSLFIKVGLQSGDLIGYDTLQTMKDSNSNTYQLSNRVVRILNYVR